jgi:two-component system, NarL family, sensor kinase
MQEEGNHILILFGASAALIFIIITLAFLFLISYQKKLVLQKLLIQKGENELQQKLLQASISSQEKERKRIASDLHDEIGSLLSVLQANMSYLKTIDRIESEERDFLNRASELIDDGLTNIRRISYDLLPPTLVRFGLWEALDELVQDLNLNHDVNARANFKALSDLKLPESVQLSIFRVIKELTSNSLHQKSVSAISMHCSKTDEIRINYQDNGHGFTKNSQSQGLGIITMQSRIQSIDGKIQFSSPSDDYFFANIAIPLTNLNHESTQSD